MRTFIAISIPQNIIENIKTAVTPLIKIYPFLKWVDPANYHLTLRFLGDTTERQVQLLDEILQLAQFPKAFTLKLERFGAFPTTNKAKVLWLGFTYPPELLELFHTLELPILNSGIELKGKETFKPHLTLARTKNNTTIVFDKPISYEIPVFDVSEFSLYKSDLKPSGPIYTKLKNYSLQK